MEVAGNLLEDRFSVKVLGCSFQVVCCKLDLPIIKISWSMSVLAQHAGLVFASNRSVRQVALEIGLVLFNDELDSFSVAYIFSVVLG